MGDCAATIELGKVMSEALNQKILSMQQWFEKNNFSGIKDTIISYNSLTLIYDPIVIKRTSSSPASAFEWVSKKAEQAFLESLIQDNQPGSIFRVPVCYDEEFGIDLAEVSSATKLSYEKIIELHLSKPYRVYMLGFLPGFAYLGELDALLDMPRKNIPVSVVAGSVGIVSNQTGVYPIGSPGGWQIIGRTPMRLFEPKENIPVKMKAGDEVEFYQITRQEFDEKDFGQ